MATIRKRRDKWQVQIRRRGQRPLSKSFHRRTEAEAWARQMEVKADRYELPVSVDPKALDRIQLGELVERYRDEICPRKRGHAIERIVLDAFLRHPLCKRTVSSLTVQDFAKYRDERLRSIKPSSLCRQLDPLRNLFEVARDEWGLPIRDNPIASLSLEKGNNTRERRLRPGEWQRLVTAARTRKNPHVLPIMEFALATAMRRGEILNMRWDHLLDDGRSLLIPKTKNGYARTIPLSPEAIRVLKCCDAHGALVYPISANAFRLAWQRIKERAGVEDLRFHDLRHEAISRFFEMGLSVPEVALISGHRDPRMLFRYTHPMREQISRKLSDASS